MMSSCRGRRRRPPAQPFAAVAWHAKERARKGDLLVAPLELHHPGAREELWGIGRENRLAEARRRPRAVLPQRRYQQDQQAVRMDLVFKP